NIPKADGGIHAWLLLASCVVFEALIWGFPFSFGVFLSYYTTHAPFSTHPNGISTIGTCSTGIMYIVALVTLHVLEAWPSIRRRCSILGLFIAVGALIASSFATHVWHLILTQGILYAIGGSFLYTPTIFYLDDWFEARKGLAFGIMWAGVGTAGLIFPFLFSTLLTHCGHATTLRIWSAVLFVLCLSLIPFLKARLPLSIPPLPRKPVSYAFFFTPTHLSLQMANILQSLGFFLPSIYLVSYCSTFDLPTASGTALLCVLNTFSAFGAVGLGWACDKWHVTTVVFVSALGSSLSVLLLWGLGTTLFVLVPFAVAYGVFAGGFSAIWTGMMKEVQRSQKQLKGEGEEPSMGTLMGVFAAGRGIGAVLSGPVSEVLLKHGGLGRKFGFGTKYGIVIVFTGVSSALCGLM
ncbi:MFS general substrate transporter, partial [Acephala macrosclerotiorum]